MKPKAIILVSLVVMMMALFVAPATAVLDTSTTLTAHEAEFLANLDYDNAASLARYLSDEIGNRFAGTVRRDMAADWIADTLKSYGYGQGNLGLEVHEFELTNSSWGKVDVLSGFFEVGGKQYIYHGPVYGATSVYTYVNETPAEFTDAEVLNWETVGSALTVPEDADYSGKAVIVTLGTGPATTNSRSATPAPSAVNYYNAALALQTAGAEAVIFQSHQPRIDGASTSAKIGNTTMGASITIPVGLTLWHETHEAVEALAAARAPIKLSMKDIDYGMNIIATIPSATGSEKTVYVSCHYDSQVSTPGMNDNGSGTIMQMEMARALKDVKFDYNIVFVFFDSEDSNSMCGSRTFVQRYMTEADKANFVANYNVDMISTSQENCIHMFLNISDTQLQTLERNLASNERLLLYPGAIEIAQKYDFFNHTYLAAQKLDFDMDYFNICYDTTTDHINFFREATRAGNNYPNMLNAVEYDWRTNEKGTGFETLYHQTGDTYAINFSQERLQTIGDMVSLAIYHSAKADIELDKAVPTASVKKLNGNKNDLTIVVTETWTDHDNIGFDIVFTETFSINNNAAGVYNVGGYQVYVDTKGNTQIRACEILP